MQTLSVRPRIAIIGSGFSGLCLGIQLKRAGIHSFTIFEKSARLGGTWRDNVYPGATCDVPSFSYCFSFEQKTDWSRKWSPQPEILAYMDHCAQRYGILSHIRFSTAVVSASFDADEGAWHIRTSTGEDVVADVLVSAVGQLHRPHVPALDGLDRFAGPVFHSARWDRDVDLRDRRVAVVGNAASAIQFIPQIAPVVRQLHIFQRSPNWMLPRGDRAYTEYEKRRFTKYPSLARLYRWFFWLRLELLFYPVIRRNRFTSKRVERLCLEHLREHISDPALQKVLTPDYPVSGKRILISDDYYQTLTRPNVRLVTDGIDHLTAEGIVTTDGASYPADVVILATGFESTSFLAPITIEGLAGRSLERDWSHGAEAYLGISVAGFPNLFLMYGPNTNLGHNSIIFMIECQTRYIIECIAALTERDLKYLDLRRDVMMAYNRRLQRKLQRTSWAATAKSWYKTADGRITNNWYGTTLQYWWKTRQVDLGAYHQVARPPAGRFVSHRRAARVTRPLAQLHSGTVSR